MAVVVTHAFVSAIPDGSDNTIVQPSDWNDNHTITGLGTAATAATTDFATAAQGALADSALQAAAIANMLETSDIGVTVQAYDADLATWAGVSSSANGRSLVSAADYAAMRALLDLEAGTDFLSPAAISAAYQPLDADLTAWAGVNPSSYSTTAQIAAAYQPLDADLTALAALAGTNTIYYRSAANTWTAVTIGSGLSFAGGSLSASGGSGLTSGQVEAARQGAAML